MIPRHTQEALDRYVQCHIPPGDFLKAVLSNNLKEAFARADDMNTEAMGDIVKYMYNNIPSACWGSKEALEEWINMKPETSDEQRVIGNGEGKIYLGYEGSEPWINAHAIAEDGAGIAGHMCSHPSFVRHDLGFIGEWKHDNYLKYYPEGFTLIYIDHMQNLPKEVLQRNQETEGKGSKEVADEPEE